MITFTKTKLPYGWLSNMATSPIEWEGKTWRSAEAVFQAMRFTDEAVREEIRVERSPMVAKFVAKKHAAKMVVQPASAEDITNMEAVLRLKVAQHPDLARELKATGTEMIVEDVTNRPHGRNKFWGMAKDGDDWKGDNVLGNLWMKIRGELAWES